ncbi:G-protein coupled receptor 22-like [Coregonus clupeaformis]|uniref:G-protein coupled receptor 22-like n=1 Tax=Coregonus clupeaformis TaxID=59861 RepID=UPI001E1C7C60|nr:G-protein coupled receptor 22-like [Coregonus clupeaformis]
METKGFTDLLETSDGQGSGLLEKGDVPGTEEGWSIPLPLGFQVSLTTVLMLELVLGFSSNLTVLVLYCAQSNLVDSVSNMVTVSLHVLDIMVCVLCLPLTVAIILLPVDGSGGGSLATLCCFHEACVTFTSVATAINVLVISLDRYDISVRPATRLLTPRRAALLLAAVWAVSLAVFFLPFLEGDFFSTGSDVEDREVGGGWEMDMGDLIPESDSEDPTGLTPTGQNHTGLTLTPSTPYYSHPLPPLWQNRTLLCVGGQGYHTGLAMNYHLLLQVPCFFIAVVVMLFTYSRILQALNIRIGTHIKRGPRASNKDLGCRIRRRRRRRKGLSLATEGGATCAPQAPTPTDIISPPPAAERPGVQASVSAIIALRRAVRRHRDRRERQRRVFKMSLIIISSFLGCWAPLSMVNVLILCLGPSDGLVRVRLCFLAMAYGTTIFHPLLYAFTRQKLRKALKTHVKKRVVSLLQVDTAPNGGTVIHNSWVEGGGQRKGRKPRLEGSDATSNCLTVAVRE